MTTNVFTVDVNLDMNPRLGFVNEGFHSVFTNYNYCLFIHIVITSYTMFIESQASFPWLNNVGACPIGCDSKNDHPKDEGNNTEQLADKQHD